MKYFFCWLTASLITVSVFAQHIRYQFAAPNAIHHEAEITVIADGLPATAAIFRMSRSSPGRYAKHEFGKNVYNVAAYNAAGQPLKVEKEDADVYKVIGHKGTVKLTYTLFGNYADGTYASIDISGYHLNMPATFMWVKGMDNAPITIQFAVPVAGWKIATQLKPTNDPFTFTAPGLQYFMDSPTKIGDLHIREWRVTNKDGKRLTFRLALEAEASEKLVDTFTEKLKRVAEAGKNVFGEYPSYDYGTYTFIASINPYVVHDGMEHRNSTMITITQDFDASDDLTNVFTHEFFHCWNVERIRPKSLEPFDFEKSNMSEALWVAEGFTQYYGKLMLVRAGFRSQAGFLNDMAAIVNQKLNTPGGRFYTPIENSQRAVFVDAGVSVDKTNYDNMYLSYYTYGAALALALDLELRSKFNKSLDDVMRELWKKHGKTEIPYTIPNVQSAVATVANAAYAVNFFNRYVYDHQPLDYNSLLATAGYSLQPRNRNEAWLGPVSADSTETGLVIDGSTIRDTPIYNSGLDDGDLIVDLDGKQIKAASDVSKVLNAHKPGDKILLTYVHRQNAIKTTINLSESPRLQIVETEKGSGTINQKLKQFRKQWMGDFENSK